jgi:hypothetical protein
VGFGQGSEAGDIGKEEGGGAVGQSDASVRTLWVDAPAGVVDTQPLQHLQQRGVPTNESGGAAPDVALARRLGRRCGGRVGTVSGFALVGHVHRSIS